MEQRKETLNGRDSKTARSTKLTIAGAYNYDARAAVPTLRLKGLWLKDLGWEMGEQVIVDASRDSIVISRVDGVEDPPGQDS